MNSFNKKRTIAKICGSVFTFVIPAMVLSSCTGLSLVQQNFSDINGTNNRRSNNRINNQNSNRSSLPGVTDPSVIGQPDNQDNPTQHEDSNPLSSSKPIINSSEQGRPVRIIPSGSSDQGNIATTTSSRPFASQPSNEQIPRPFSTIRISSNDLTNTGLLGADSSDVVINLANNNITLGSTIKNYFSTSLQTVKLLEIFTNGRGSYNPNFIFTDKKPSDWKTYADSNSFYVSNGTRGQKAVTVLNFIFNSIEYTKINNLITVNNLKPNVVTRTADSNADLVLFSSHVSDNSLINNSFLQFNVVTSNNKLPFTLDLKEHSITFDNLTLEKRVYLDKNRSSDTVRNWIVSLGKFTVYNAF
ncbi:hypothetical protein [Mycoplasma tullyi]|uniref:hypothetical protein n=1 Tax=Mycoplasma tullyi TaxID=1612150 RepID=UPI001E29037D|nr:hypothetical protein [Mycoplasma tullyi]